MTAREFFSCLLCFFGLLALCDVHSCADDFDDFSCVIDHGPPQITEIFDVPIRRHDSVLKRMFYLVANALFDPRSYPGAVVGVYALHKSLDTGDSVCRIESKNPVGFL